MGFASFGNPTRLRADSDGEWLTGDIELGEGVGGPDWQHLEGDPQRMVLNIAATAPPLAMPLFTPGAIADAQELGRFTAPTATGEYYLRRGEINVGTLPTGADGTDNLAVRFRGESSGETTVPLFGSADGHWSFDAFDAATVAQPGAQTSDGLSAQEGYQIVRMRADTDVTGILMKSLRRRDGGTIRDLRCRLIDYDTGETLGTSGLFDPSSLPSDAGSTTEDVTFEFGEVVSLTDGQAVVLVLDIPDRQVGEWVILRASAGSATGEVGADYIDQPADDPDGEVSDGDNSVAVNDNHGNFNSGLGWPIDPGGDAGGSSVVFDMHLVGYVGGVAMSGDLIVDVVANGTGGTSAPEDVNTLAVTTDESPTG